ncbi:hypothetical protein BOX15_Mlig010927g2 [Macrostomum lignano]|uniref:Uncharacterized protein n=1 Tax=Macrostomum lignano TaxID=282301 RepID=A0A267EYQ4_9PLAT|nr:hypothetical protein BOX15_Mlig010927g2 [Macrostomum lignano]
MTTEAPQHLYAPSNRAALNVPAAVAAAAAARDLLQHQERRGSAESAYYSTYSDGDRRGSWQELSNVSCDGAADTSATTGVRRASSSSALCEECEIRRFRPADRSPFHTRAHAEAVMAEFARLHGDRAAAAASTAGVCVQPEPYATVSSTSASLPSTAKSPILLQLPQTSQPHSPHCLLAAPVSPSASVDPMPTLAEEDSPLVTDNLSESFDGSIGRAGRLNTVSSCDLRRNRRLSSRGSLVTSETLVTSKASPGAVETAAKPIQSMSSISSSNRRKFSLDASTVTTPSLGGRPAQLLRRPSAAGGATGGMYRLFHHETTQEELEAFNQSRRGSKASGTGSPTSPDQNPSRLFRRFQSNADDYFVALKVEEEQLPESLPADCDRQKLLSIGEDGSTVVTELSKIPEISTPAPSCSNSDRSTKTTTADESDSTVDAATPQVESEIEISLRLAKTSPFAYVPPVQLQPAPARDCRTPERRRPSNGSVSTMSVTPTTTERRDSAWRRCVSEMSAAAKTSRSASASGAIGLQVGGGSRVKQLMALFGDAK